MGPSAEQHDAWLAAAAARQAQRAGHGERAGAERDLVLIEPLRVGVGGGAQDVVVADAIRSPCSMPASSTDMMTVNAPRSHVTGILTRTSPALTDSLSAPRWWILARSCRSRPPSRSAASQRRRPPGAVARITTQSPQNARSAPVRRLVWQSPPRPWPFRGRLRVMNNSSGTPLLAMVRNEYDTVSTLRMIPHQSQV